MDYEIDTPAELAKAFYVKQDMGLGDGTLVTTPIPEEYSMDADVINRAIDEAVAEANTQGIHGKESTPFLLAKIQDQRPDRRRFPGLQHPAGVQQRPAGRSNRWRTEPSCQRLRFLIHWTGRSTPVSLFVFFQE